jgi:hypothetical protein
MRQPGACECSFNGSLGGPDAGVSPIAYVFAADIMSFATTVAFAQPSSQSDSRRTFRRSRQTATHLLGPWAPSHH